MKILLINPPITRPICETEPIGGTPPLGLGYIAGVIDQAGYEVKILDTLTLGVNNVIYLGDFYRTGLSEINIKEYIENFDPDVVGITCPYTAYAQDAHDIAKIVKEVDLSILVVVGGTHPTSVPAEVLKDKNIDIIVSGEGEITFLEIVKRLEKGENIYSVDGTIIRKGNGILRNSDRAFIENLDSIPFPARHLLPMDMYLSVHKKSMEYRMRTPCTTMITSRGCPGHCVYCSIHCVWGRKWRARSPANIVDEIELLTNQYKIKEIHFLDDNISLNSGRLNDICDEIIKRKIDIKWTAPNGIAIWTLNEKLIEKMKKSGCYRLTFGLESGNSDTLNFIGKHYNYEHARTIIRHANKIGLWTISTFIIGFPLETISSITDTINRSIDSDIDFAVYYIAAPFPGTKLYDVFEEQGLFHSSYTSIFSGGSDTKYFTKEELKELQGKAYSQFLRSRLPTFPLRVLRKINSFEDLIYAAKITGNAVKLFKSGNIRTSTLHKKGPS